MTEQEFLKDLENKLWKTANKLLPALDAAVYKHVVLGLVFLKYVSDSFDDRSTQLKTAFRDSDNEYYLGDDVDDEFISEELENRDYYTEKNIFWVPKAARWNYLQDNIRLTVGSPLPLGGEFKSAGKLIDDTMELIEKENPKLRKILNKNYAQLQIEQTKLAELLDLIASIPFSHDSLKSKDILGHVYEYFLGMFAAAEGKKGGQFYTPKSIVNLIVEMVEPYEGRVYDPAMGSGGFFISSEKFIEEHQGKIGNISVYGQESNPTTWRLAAMNMAIRGIDFNFGKEPAGSFTNNQHPDLRADFVLANPPFNQDEDQWWDASLEGDARWVYGTPPKGNGNYGWMQHMLYHTSPDGVVGLVLANGSLSTASGGEDVIRKNIVEADLVEAIVALPAQLFSNTGIPACIWILNKNKAQKGKTLFINASKQGYMLDSKQKSFSDADVLSLVEAFHSWRSGVNYEDITGQYYSANTDEIAEQDYKLTPGRYVGIAEDVDLGIPLKFNLEIYSHWLNSNTKILRDVEKKISDNLCLVFPYYDWNDITYSSNKILESLAQAIYKSWFVDFDPVHAKVNANSNADFNKIEQELGISREILDLFPDEFEESEMGTIPKGWEYRKITEVCSTIGSGGTPKRMQKDNFNGAINWFTTKELQNGFISSSIETITEKGLSSSSAKLFPINTVVMAIYAAPTVGRLGILTQESTFNQAACGFVANKDKLSYEFLYLYLRDRNGYLNNLANGAAQQNLNVGLVKNLDVLMPCEMIMKSFQSLVESIFCQIKNNSQQIERLQKTRDTLLPKLLSGELDVSQLELDDVTD